MARFPRILHFPDSGDRVMIDRVSNDVYLARLIEADGELSVEHGTGDGILPAVADLYEALVGAEQ